MCVDNLAPSVPDNLDFDLMANEITINWNNCFDHDFDYFAIYKSDVSGEFSQIPFATTTQPVFADQLTEGEVVYYVITATDYHGNESSLSDEVETVPSMRWHLTEGWTGISSYIDPSDAGAASMFESIESQLVILQNESGFYWPGQNINTLGSWDMESGYGIKLMENVTLSVSRTRAQNRTLSLEE